MLLQSEASNDITSDRNAMTVAFSSTLALISLLNEVNNSVTDDIFNLMTPKDDVFDTDIGNIMFGKYKQLIQGMNQIDFANIGSVRGFRNFCPDKSPTEEKIKMYKSKSSWMNTRGN